MHLILQVGKMRPEEEKSKGANRRSGGHGEGTRGVASNAPM